jgi:hypothetical protein
MALTGASLKGGCSAVSAPAYGPLGVIPEVTSGGDTYRQLAPLPDQ